MNRLFNPAIECTDAERNQIICENHCKQYPLDYRNDI